MRGAAAALVLALGVLLGSVSGERFLISHVSVTREEDTTELNVLDDPLECGGFRQEFYLGNEEPVPFEVRKDDFFAYVRFTRSPDAELGDELYDVYVVCDDGDSSQPPATATVTVTITSVNEYTPYAPEDSYSVSFLEAAREGDLVASVGSGTDQYLIIDEDGGLDGRLSFTALDDPPNPHFSVVAETGDVILMTEFDYEKQPDFSSSMLIHGCDLATPPALCPNITVNFTLAPANDNDPHFLQSQYWVQVEEGLHRATPLMTNITCTDDDIGEGSYGGMEVVSSTLNFIELSDTATGTARLLLTAALDYDFTNITEFEVELCCHDRSSGGDERSDETTVHIEVLPANDHPPQFLSQWFNTSILESVPVGSFLQTAQCTDDDRGYGKFSAISLYKSSLEVNQTFHLDPPSGRLTLTATLDYDDPATRSHVFTISCTDDGGLEALAMVTIATLPVSDEPLTFQYPVFKITVDRLTSVNSRVGQVIAIDGDQGEVPVIIYSLEDNDLFEIEEDGYIVLTDYLSRDKGDFFNLTVQARDSQGAIEGRVEISVVGLLSLLGVINVVIGAVGILVVIIIGVMVAPCCYFCWKLYHSNASDTTEVPVKYMSGNRIPHHRPSCAHSRSSGGAKCQSMGNMRERSTLSMQRTKKKKAGSSFRKKTRQRPNIRDSFFANQHTTALVDDDQVLFGNNPQDFEMTLFTTEVATSVDEKEDEEKEDSTHNIFNPEDAGLMLGDIMLFPGEEQTRWNKDEDENDAVVDMGSWPLVGEEREDMGEEGEGEGEISEEDDSGSESGGSGEWDLTQQDTDSFTLSHI